MSITKVKLIIPYSQNSLLMRKLLFSLFMLRYYTEEIGYLKVLAMEFEIKDLGPYSLDIEHGFKLRLRT